MRDDVGMRPSELIDRGPVTLRRWRVGDADELYRVIADTVEHLRPWMPWAQHHDLERTRVFLIEAELEWSAGQGYGYAVCADGRIVGSTALMAKVGPGGLELGYWLHRSYTGRGYMSIAAGALVDEAAGLPGIDYVEVHHDAANTASGAGASRLGFTEVERRPRPRSSLAPADSGVEVVWRRAVR